MKSLKFVMMSQLMAPVIALDFPQVEALTVDSLDELPRGMTTSYYGIAELDRPRELPARLLVRGSTRAGSTWRFGINLERSIVEIADWRTLQRDQGGSGDLGICALGVPSLLATSPFLIAAHASYGLARLVTGMDRHTWAIWLRLSPLLPTEYVDVVHQSFLNHCNGVEDEYMRRLREELQADDLREELANSFESRRADPTRGPFMARLAAGAAQVGEVMDDVAAWHDRSAIDRHVGLSEWLGMNDREFDDWCTQKRTVVQILADREQKAAPTVPDLPLAQR